MRAPNEPKTTGQEVAHRLIQTFYHKEVLLSIAQPEKVPMARDGRASSAGWSRRSRLTRSQVENKRIAWSTVVSPGNPLFCNWTPLRCRTLSRTPGNAAIDVSH